MSSVINAAAANHVKRQKSRSVRAASVSNKSIASRLEASSSITICCSAFPSAISIAVSVFLHFDQFGYRAPHASEPARFSGVFQHFSHTLKKAVIIVFNSFIVSRRETRTSASAAHLRTVSIASSSKSRFCLWLPRGTCWLRACLDLCWRHHGLSFRMKAILFESIFLFFPFPFSSSSLRQLSVQRSVCWSM